MDKDSTLTESERLDQHVVRVRVGLSRAFVSKLISQGSVTVNGKVVTKAGYRLRPDDKVKVSFDQAAATDIPNIDVEVLYEDDDCVVINKPAGLLSHSKGAFSPEATVATWVSGRTTGLEGDRTGIVHRLDRATSGVMICAKNPEALSWLQKQFSQRKTKKTYIAIVKGEPKEQMAIIDMPIERNPKRPQTFRVGSNGKPALTSYKVLETSDRYSLVELKPTTGRTHQLRVHMEQLGHPIVGDTLYDGEKANRMYLHAYKLEITLPNGMRKIFEAILPDEFMKKIKS